MNIFLRELRSHLKGLFFWSIGMFGIIEIAMMKYSALAESAVQTAQFMKQFPPMVQAVVGMEGLDIQNAGGFYGLVFFYVAIMAVVHAGLLGESLFTREERGKTVEFLYARPISRNRIVSEKLLVGLACIIVLNLVVMGSSFIATSGYVSPSEIAKEILVFMVVLLIMQAMFLCLGTLLAAAFRNPKIAGPLIAAFVLANYLDYIFYKLVPWAPALRSMSLLSLFDAADLVPNMDLDPGRVAACLIFIAVCTVGTYLLHGRRDFRF